MRRALQKQQSPEGPRPNVLMAIPYCDQKSLAVIQQHGERVRFLLDSGAFTAWKQGKEVHLDDYCRFIDSLRFRPFGYFSLDVIGDPVGTRANFNLIAKRGLRPIPIFTRGSDWKELDDWFEQSDYVGVGGGTGTKGFPLFIRDVSRRTAGKKVHWLGFTDRDFLAHWKPFSCDSSSPENAVMYNNVVCYQGAGKLQFIHRSKFREDAAKWISVARPWFDFLGEDMFALRTDDGWKRLGVADRVTRKAWAAYAIEVEQRFGTKVFLATVSAEYLQANLDAWWDVAERMGVK